MIVSDTDLTGQPLFPGHGIVCQPVTLTTAARTARAAVQIAKWVLEELP